ncbi:hypothetical protein LTS18_001517, partial [Coniosporium uncinatum]
RVAELERKIDALTASLQARENGAYPDGYAREPRNSLSASPYSTHHQPYQPDKRLLGEEQQREQQQQQQQQHQSSSGFTRQATEPPSAASRKRRRVDEKSESSDEEVQTIRRELLMNHAGSAIPNNYNERKPIIFDHSDIDGKISAIIDHGTAQRLFDHYVNHIVPNFPAVPFPPGTKAQT